MTNRHERLKQVYEYVRTYKGVHTQSDFAELLHMTRPALSSAMNGKEAYLTDNLFQKICAAFPGIFNLDYLLNGTGELLAQSEPSPGINKDEEVNKIILIYENELRDLKLYHARECEAYQTTIATLKENNLMLKERIAELTAQLSQCQSEDVLKNFPFAPGVADSKKGQIDTL